MATSRIKIATGDENANLRLDGPLKNKAALSENSNMTTAANDPQRRVVLGDRLNQVQPKNNASRVVKANLKDVRSKVDSHWKRSDSQPVPVPTAAVPVTKRVAPSAVALTRESNKTAAATTTTTSHLVADAVKRATSKCSSTVAESVRPAVALFKKAAIVAPLPQQVSHTTRQLSQVDDIDAQDADNPFLMSEYVVDIYKYLQELETRYPIREGFLDHHSEISPRMRSVLIDWINEVHFQFKLLPETYFMAIGLIDRYLQLDIDVARRDLQLVGATALFVAAKYEELYPPVLADFVYITDNTYTEAQVIEMEKRMLCTLKFELCPPVAIHFLRRYSKTALSETMTHTMAKYFIELTTIDYQMCQYSASMKAAASLYLALILLKTKTSLAEMRFIDFWRGRGSRSPQAAALSLWSANLAHYSSYPEEQLRPVVQKLAALVLSAPKAKTCRAIHNKYSLTKFEKCAQLPELSGSFIRTLATDWTAATESGAGAAAQ